MNSEHLSDEQVHVHGAPSYSVRAEIFDEQGQRHLGFLAVTPSELAQLNINLPETWPVGTRAVADGSLYSLFLPGPMRMWRRIGADQTRRPAPPQGHPPAPTRGRHASPPGAPAPGARRPAPPPHGRPAPPSHGRPAPPPQGRPAPPHGAPRAPGGGRPAPSPQARPVPHARPAPPPYAPPAPPQPYAAPPPYAPSALPPPYAYPVEPPPYAPPSHAHHHGSVDGWGPHVHSIYDDGSIALYDGRAFAAEEIEHYYDDGLIILRNGQQFVPPDGFQPVYGGTVTTWAAPADVPGQSAVHNGVAFAGLPAGTIFFDEDHSFGYQTPQGEVVTGYWNPNGTFRVDDPALDDVRKAAAEGAAEGLANALESMGGGGGGYYEDDAGSLLSLLE